MTTAANQVKQSQRDGHDMIQSIHLKLLIPTENEALNEDNSIICILK